jgi:peptidoglycan/xylan/chitin deacetylase (PgdA/CDA1 family)
MSPDWSRTLLLWDPGDPARFGLDPADFRSRGMMTLEASYDRIGRDPGLVDEIRARDPEAILFTRNDDMAGNPPIGKLLQQTRTGYTAISAIDPEFQEDQTRQCMRDCLEGKGQVEIPPPAPVQSTVRRANGTFSLIFDLEQFGGARFAMPRLLPILESAGVRATFFVTGFIAEVYPALLHRIEAGGHEIAVHGCMHEFLQDRSLEDQLQRIRGQVEVLRRFGEVRGANFIFRMDEHSPEAFLRAGLDYFVLFRKHVFYRSRFMEASSRCRPFRTGAGDLTVIPIGSETYALPRDELEGSIASSWRCARKEGENHISVLMHPFKDGRLARLDQTRWTIRLLQDTMGLKSIPLRETRRPQSAPDSAVLIKYRWDGREASARNAEKRSRLTAMWWTPQLYHSRRTENLCDGLLDQGVPAILSSDVSPGPNAVCVCPDTWDGEVEEAPIDPIRNPKKAARQISRGCVSENPITVLPPNRLTDLINFALFHMPRTWTDLLVFWKRMRLKTANLFRKSET